MGDAVGGSLVGADFGGAGGGTTATGRPWVGMAVGLGVYVGGGVCVGRGVLVGAGVSVGVCEGRCVAVGTLVAVGTTIPGPRMLLSGSSGRFPPSTSPAKTAAATARAAVTVAVA